MRSYFEVNDHTTWDLKVAFKTYHTEYKNFGLTIARMEQDLIDITKLPNILQSTVKSAKKYLKQWEKYKKEFRSFLKEVENEDKAEGITSKTNPIQTNGQQISISKIESIGYFQNINGNLIQEQERGESTSRNKETNQPTPTAVSDDDDDDDDDSVDIEFPSDLSKDYHPLVEEDDYTLNDPAQDSEIEKTGKWCIELNEEDGDILELDIIDELKVFRTVSTQIEPTSLSDLRLLALNYTYLFTADIKTSINAYFPETAHKMIMKQLLIEPAIELSDHCIIWCNKLSQVRMPNWQSIQNITVPFLNEALKKVEDEPTDLIIANILHRAGLLFASGVPESNLEDSFVHNFIANLFENIFQSEHILSSNWANGLIGGKRKSEDEDPHEFKPDYVLFVTQRSHRLDLTCAEAKSPSNRAVFPKSDLVKTGQEMRWMFNKLVREGVQNPVVGGILISGYDMHTFKMDMVDDSIYRLTELSKTLIFRNLNELTMLPIIVSNLLQLKQITLSTATKVKDRLREKAKGVFPNPEPPLSWLRDNTVDLVKRQKKS